MTSRSETRLFLLSFSSAFFLIALLFLFMVAAIHPATPESLQADAAAEEEAYLPDEKDALTLFLIGVQTPDAPADTFVLMRFDPVGNQVLVAALPPGTMLRHGGKSETLSEAYRYGGALYTKNVLSEYLNLPIDRYARITLNSFILSANAVGTIEFTLDESITLVEGEIIVTLNQGTQLLDGRKVAGLMRRDGIPAEERCILTAQLICAVVDQRIDVVRSTLLDKIFETIINLVDTDISYADYALRKEAATQLSNASAPIARAIDLAGEWEGDHFYLHDTSLVQLVRSFL